MEKTLEAIKIKRTPLSSNFYRAQFRKLNILTILNRNKDIFTTITERISYVMGGHIYYFREMLM